MLERLSAHMLTPLIQASCALLVLVLLRRLHTWAWGSSPSRLSLPPGPRGLPIVGNIRDVPSMPTWVTYKKWSDTYGRETSSVKFLTLAQMQYNIGSPVVSLKIFGRTIVVLNTLQAVTDLLEKRSAIYSDR